MRKVFLVSCLLMFSVLANAATFKLADIKIYLDGSLMNPKIGSGSITLVTKNGDIDKLKIATKLTAIGSFKQELRIEEFQRGNSLKFYIDGRSTPILIIKPKVHDIMPDKKLAATLKVATSKTGYSSYSISIEKTSGGSWKLWRNYTDGRYKMIKTLGLTFKRSTSSVTNFTIN
jgi:hypothetical protein